MHLGVLVLRVELDDGGADLAAIGHRIGSLLGEVLTEDVLRAVGLPRPRPAGDQRVPEDERIARVVVVFQPVIDRWRRRGGPDLLAADREVTQKDPVVGYLQPGLDLLGIVGLPDHRLRFRHAVGHPPFQLAVVVGLRPVARGASLRAVLVEDGDGLEFGDELVIGLVDLVGPHRPSGVNLRRVVGVILLGVLEAGDTTEQRLAVGIGREQVAPDADRRPVAAGDVGPEGGLVPVLGDPQPWETQIVPIPASSPLGSTVVASKSSVTSSVVPSEPDDDGDEPAASAAEPSSVPASASKSPKSPDRSYQPHPARPTNAFPSGRTDCLSPATVSGDY